MHTINDIKKYLPPDSIITGNINACFEGIDSIFEAKKNSLTWISNSIAEPEKIIENCNSSIIICDKSFIPGKSILLDKTFIQTHNPALAFLRIVKGLYTPDENINGIIHHTVIIDKDALIGKNVEIGPFSIIGKCQIGDNTTIKSHTIIHNNITIGKNVLISEYCNIGGQGFGHIPNEDGIMENMLHIGNVIIEDNVEIFPYTNVDRATLSYTKIGRNTKIDHYCHIGHNASIGENSVITAKVVLCGGSKVGNNCWIGVGGIIRDKISVGNNVTTGMGAIITKNIPDGEIWAGNPARKMDELNAINQKLRDLLNSDS